MPAPTSNAVVDGFVTVEAGMNSGVWPVILEPGQLAFAVNTTCRGGLAQNRAGFLKNPFDFDGDTVLQNRVQNGRFQGAAIYQADGGTTTILASISGRLYQFIPDRSGTEIQDITISITTTTTQAFVVPGVGQSVTVVVASTAGMADNFEIQIAGSNYIATQIVDGTTLLATNVDAIPGAVVQPGAILTFWDTNPSNRPQVWMTQAERWMVIQDGQSVPIFFDGATSRRSNIAVGGSLDPEIRPGRMGAYGFGRLWMAGTDGRTYFAGDLVGSSSGTPEFNRRDAVLKMTENTYLDGGGSFIVPGNIGFIQGMGFVAILDQSLGQGPLQVFTPLQIFSCNTPVDRTEWAAVENPIQTISQITSGTTSHWSLVPVNGDFFYRAIDGIRSLVLGRREFNVHGNTPQSTEMERILQNDDEQLLGFASGALFDNRMLMTCSPAYSQRGVYHRGLIALDFDTISSMRGKKPPAYDGLWTGLQVLQILSGRFNNQERAYAFVLTGQGIIELWELTKRTELLADNNGTTPTLWSIETGALFKGQQQGGLFVEKQLVDGELFVDDVRGRVDFQVYFRADNTSCWTEWHRWSICADTRTCADPEAIGGCATMVEKQPQSFPRMGFGTPPSTCNPVSQKQYRNGRTFQIKVQVQGWCRIVGMNVSAVTIPQQAMAPRVCTGSECFPPLISRDPTYANTEQSYTAECPEGETGDSVTVTIAAGTVLSAVSVADANATALAIAQSQAEEQLECDPGTCWIESLANTAWRIQAFNPVQFDFTGDTAADNPWGGTFPTYTDVDPDYKLWEAASGVSINGWEVYAFCDFNGCDGDGNRIWTVYIQSPDFLTNYWTGTKVGGVSPAGVYTKDGGTSTGPDTLTVEEDV